MGLLRTKDDHMRVLGEFLAFGGIGVIGFVVDATVLYTGAALGLGLYLGRICSYLAAVTATWALNRHFTFGGGGGGPLLRQWAAFATSQLGGASINLGAYSLLVATSPFVAKWPVIGVAIGSILGLFANFALAKRFIFRGQPGSARTASLPPHPAPPAASRPAIASRRAFVAAAMGVLAIVSLCWTAFVNGQPFFFADTTAYVRGVDVAVQKAVGIATVWSGTGGAGQETDPSVQPAPAPKTQSLSSVNENAVLAGRSVYYGALLYAGHIAGGFWLTVLAQAFFIAASIFLTIRAFFGDALGRSIFAIGALAILTPISFFVAYLMPDVFAGIAILACVNLLVFPTRLRRFELMFWFAALALAFAFHSSHLLTGLAFAAFAVVWAVLHGGIERWRAFAILLAAILTGILAESVFNIAVTKIIGMPPIRPPFLMARVIEDGPGYQYLKEACPQKHYAVCAFVDRLPLTSDDFLWNSTPRIGVFAVADAATRRALSAEQMAFVAAVIAFDPVGQFAASLRNGLKQLGMFGLTEFNYGEGARSYFAAKLPPSYLDAMTQTLAYKEAMPTLTLSWVVYGTVLVSICLVLSMQLFAGAGRIPVAPEFFVFTVLILAGIVVNALVCGALSSPHDRYQARVVWLIPLLALIYEFGRRSNWRGASVGACNHSDTTDKAAAASAPLGRAIQHAFKRLVQRNRAPNSDHFVGVTTQ